MEYKAKKVFLKDKDGNYLIPFTDTGSGLDDKITNCLLEVPQNIKLELNNGTLTLKAGSKVIVPNGAGIFDEVVIVNDITFNPSNLSNRTGLLYVKNSLGTPSLGLATETASTSGATTPSTGWHYNTTDNIVYRDGNAENISLPIAIVTNVNGTGATSINQVFNGMGYIGSTVWVDKGVKGLIPNGRNEDGTLKNKEFTTNKIMTRNFTGTWQALLGVKADNISPLNVSAFSYNLGENINTSKDNGTVWSHTTIAKFSITNGVISNFQPKLPFRAVDYNDKQEIGTWGLPSVKFVDFTLGASGTNYIMPANGWLTFSKRLGAATAQYIAMYNNTTNMYLVNTIKGDKDNELCVFLPVRKGDSINIGYNATGETTRFRFHYAEGEV